MAEYENSTEQVLRDIFDLSNKELGSVLFGKLSPASKAKEKISRVTFNSAATPIAQIFGYRDAVEVYNILNSYLKAFIYGYLKKNDLIEKVANATVFKSTFSIFPEVASTIKDRFGPDYSIDNYMEVMAPMYSKINNQRIKKPGTSYKTLAGYLSSCMKSDFTL